MVIWQLLIEFVFRLIFGLVLAMGVTPRGKITSGYYRVHLWVVLGLSTFAGLAAFTQAESLSGLIGSPRMILGLAGGLALLAYVGAVAWLYEQATVGRVVLYVCVVMALAGAYATTSTASVATAGDLLLVGATIVTSGLLLGSMIAAMFLGHWYLNTPTMEIEPLRRLVRLIGMAVGARMLVCGIGLALVVASGVELQTSFWIFVTFRWLGGLIGPAILVVLTWYTLNVPNTQSATGILYAGVVLTFLGELTSLLLSVNAAHPL